MLQHRPADTGLHRPDGDLRVLAVEQGIDMGEHGGTALRRKADGEGAFFGIRQVLKPETGIPLHPQHLPGRLQVNLPGLRGRPAPPGTVKKRGANLPLQMEQLLVEGGGGQVQLFRRPGDAPLLRNFDHVGDLLEIHVFPPRCRRCPPFRRGQGLPFAGAIQLPPL